MRHGASRAGLHRLALALEGLLREDLARTSHGTWDALVGARDTPHSRAIDLAARALSHRSGSAIGKEDNHNHHSDSSDDCP